MQSLIARNILLVCLQDGFFERRLTAELLREINIVDTPGAFPALASQCSRPDPLNAAKMRCPCCTGWSADGSHPGGNDTGVCTGRVAELPLQAPPIILDSQPRLAEESGLEWGLAAVITQTC